MIFKKLFRPKVMPAHVDDANFARVVLESELPLVLDIWSTSCVHCQRLEEVMIQLATDFQGRVVVAELGTHLAPMSAARLQVSALPTVIYFERGEEKERVMGFRSSLYHREAIAEIFGIAR